MVRVSQQRSDALPCRVRPHRRPARRDCPGYLNDGPVALFASDESGDEPIAPREGIRRSPLGTADPTTLCRQFSDLSEGGGVIDGLQTRAWSASDGQGIDRHGIHWLIGSKATRAAEPGRQRTASDAATSALSNDEGERDQDEDQPRCWRADQRETCRHSI